MELRDYQLEAIQVVEQEYKNNISKMIIAIPTGGGKTAIAVGISKHFLAKKVLFIAHRDELIQQAYKTFKAHWQEVDIGICQDDRNEIDCHVVIGTIQSCGKTKRLEKLKKRNFDLLFLDEAHHVHIDSLYAKLINELGFNGGGKMCIGLSATPWRTDKHALGDIFEKIVFQRSIEDMIDAGYLSPVIGRKIKTGVSLKGIKSRLGDFAIDELATRVNVPSRNKIIVDNYIKYCDQRTAVAFCADVAHCRDLCETFLAAGIPAAFVYGAMPKEERKKILDDLKSGKIRVILSVGILVEGFDEPSISVVLMATPTKSKLKFVQCIGRGLRLYEGKTNCLVLDFTDKAHNLKGVVGLKKTLPQIHVDEDEEHYETALGRLMKRPSNPVDVMQVSDKEFDLLGNQNRKGLLWLKLEDEEYSLLDDNNREIIIQKKDEGYIASLWDKDVCMSIVAKPLERNACMRVCEDYARNNLRLTYADLASNWLSNAEDVIATPQQRDFLTNYHAFRRGMSKANAALEIRRIVTLKNKKKRSGEIEPATHKQKYFLGKKGIDASSMSKLEAMRKISAIIDQEKNR